MVTTVSISASVAFSGCSYPDPGGLVSGLFTLAVRKKSGVSGDRIKPTSISCRKITDIVTDWNVPALTTAAAKTGMVRTTWLSLKSCGRPLRRAAATTLVTFTAPSSYWYLRHFDFKGIEAHVDWISLMSYDLHGV
ncbi:hypothetical protein BGZ61DRAFT_539509 [Ilyonectria robusta]|uniref:uncharacterized protein n=1 Tax=Ilyonectria robusta TaxID=1079257 RepID=UPI001E8D7DA4|nr:uncharacterized protein BGZ61DRAFT_539509 [Ilyonectria robusta]KAH8662800.1 hypothetical protein BGZ61DRAFT_539509 [Ilyonectria robusta]